MKRKALVLFAALSGLGMLLSACSRQVPEPGGYYITQIDPTNSYATGSLLGYSILLNIQHGTGVYQRWTGKTATIYFGWGQEFHIYSKDQLGSLVAKGVYQYRLNYKHDKMATIYMPTDRNLTINLVFLAQKQGTFSAVFGQKTKDTMQGTFVLKRGHL